ncbi:B3 domain-containing protein REM14 [Eutrema salsugineum]|uniref:B3 domain-containing protein REM14 n=1 Tax=Eutrema salsugineum TaxID=72664 RepID=UPI000CED5B7C|nr:B3 domain-containing protein REM14 [Eutrema salsugineum]
MVNKHFFKPILPGFHSHLRWVWFCTCMLFQTIPVAFFSKYIQGTNEQKMTTAKLRSDVSKTAWKVKIEEDGQKLTDGWKQFALAHDLRTGDILIFRHEKGMSFHVEILGPSGCEVQYESCSDDKSSLGELKNPRKETKSSSLVDHSRFVANVAPSTLSDDALNIPMSFARANGLGTRCGEIVLMNEKGRSWNLALKQKKCGKIYIRGGWRSFCSANGLNVGDLFTFNLFQRGKTPVLRLYPKTEAGSSSSSLDPSCFVAKISPATLRYDSLRLPVKFWRENGLNRRCGEIVLMNEKGTSWTLNLKQKRSSCGTMFIRRGWRSFCRANGLRAGDSITFKLIQRGGNLFLRLTSTESKEECSEGDEIESLSTESESDHEEMDQDEKSFKNPRSLWKASSSASQNLFLTLTLKPYNLTKSNLYLPVTFTKFHGINEETKMHLLDKHGVKWYTNLRSAEKGKKIRLVGGWKDFFKANCVR